MIDNISVQWPRQPLTPRQQLWRITQWCLTAIAVLTVLRLFWLIWWVL